MSLTEYERLQILKWFEEAMGPALGANMMKLLPPVGWGDIATKADLAALEYRLDTRIDGVLVTLRGEMAELRSELRGEMAELRGELRGEMAELRGEMAELRGEMAELRGEMRGLPGEMTKTFVTWLLASQAAVIAVVGFLLR